MSIKSNQTIKGGLFQQWLDNCMPKTRWESASVKIKVNSGQNIGSYGVKKRFEVGKMIERTERGDFMWVD